jgi:hypothetical protein
MTRRQLILDDLFRDQVYGPRNGFLIRGWQNECAGKYINSVLAWDTPVDLDFSVSVTPGRQHRFMLYGGTGCGKTKASAYKAAILLNLGKVNQVVVVVPNRSILRKTRRDFLEFFGIDLMHFSGKSHKDGVPRTKQGYILTYAHLTKNPQLHRRLGSAPERTLVIFDEVHHLGENGWGDAATEAFGLVPFVLCLSLRQHPHPVRLLRRDPRQGWPLSLPCR